MGRSKIPITWIKSDASRQVTFNKRKKGMKKKAEELAILCGVDVCMICYGPAPVSSSSNGGGGDGGGKSNHSEASSSGSSSGNSVPFSWGMPGVSSVIAKFEGLPREERDKKKLDNTSLLEQQIKKLRRELKTKLDHNWKLEQEHAFLAWDDRLDCYSSVEELRRFADCLLEKMRNTFERISYWEAAAAAQQQQVQKQEEIAAAAAAPPDQDDPAGAIRGDSSSVVVPQQPPAFLNFVPQPALSAFVLPSQQHQQSDLEQGFPAAAAGGAPFIDATATAAAAAAAEGLLPAMPSGGGMWTGSSSDAVLTSTFPCHGWAAPPPLLQTIKPGAESADGNSSSCDATPFRIYEQ